MKENLSRGSGAEDGDELLHEGFVVCRDLHLFGDLLEPEKVLDGLSVCVTSEEGRPKEREFKRREFKRREERGERRLTALELRLGDPGWDLRLRGTGRG